VLTTNCFQRRNQSSQPPHNEDTVMTKLPTAIFIVIKDTTTIKLSQTKILTTTVNVLRMTQTATSMTTVQTSATMVEKMTNLKTNKIMQVSGK